MPNMDNKASPHLPYERYNNFSETKKSSQGFVHKWYNTWLSYLITLRQFFVEIFVEKPFFFFGSDDGCNKWKQN